jgi:hypothetical protein
MAFGWGRKSALAVVEIEHGAEVVAATSTASRSAAAALELTMVSAPEVVQQLTPEAILLARRGDVTRDERHHVRSCESNLPTFVRSWRGVVPEECREL